MTTGGSALSMGSASCVSGVMNVPTVSTFDTAHTIGVDIRHTCQQCRQWWGDVESQVGGVDTMYQVSNSVSTAAGWCKLVL